MFFEYSLTVPANTPLTALAESEVALDNGTITRVEIQFPPGCYGLVGARVLERLHQLYPTNTGGWFVADSYVISFSDSYEFFGPSYRLMLQAYNLDTVYGHTIRFRFQVTERGRTLADNISQLFRRPVPARGE